MVIRYSALWITLAIIAIFNGLIREKTYGKFVSELAAHQLSTVTCVIFSGLFIYAANRMWPIESSNQAWLIGFIWLISTVIFEFVFGHYIARHSWSQLLNDYNILEGRVWGVFLVWVLIMPVVIRKI